MSKQTISLNKRSAREKLIDNDEIEQEQTRCRISNQGHLWMVHWYDDLPPKIRAALRQSAFNLCAACLTTIYLPKVMKQQRSLSHERALAVAIKIYEREEHEALIKGGNK